MLSTSRYFCLSYWLAFDMYTSYKNSVVLMDPYMHTSKSTKSVLIKNLDITPPKTVLECIETKFCKKKLTVFAGVFYGNEIINEWHRVYSSTHEKSNVVKTRWHVHVPHSTVSSCEISH